MFYVIANTSTSQYGTCRKSSPVCGSGQVTFYLSYSYSYLKKIFFRQEWPICDARQNSQTAFAEKAKILNSQCNTVPL